MASAIRKPFHDLAQELQLHPETSVPISFLMVARSAANTFPDHVHRASLNFRIWSSATRRSLPRKNVIYYDDQDVTFVDFHGEESGFRWSRARGELRDFVFPTAGKKVRMTLMIGQVRKPEDLNIKMFINGNVPARLIDYTAENFRFQVNNPTVSEITSVTIQSESFIPLQLKNRLDTRELGIRFVRLRFETE